MIDDIRTDPLHLRDMLLMAALHLFEDDGAVVFDAGDIEDHLMVGGLLIAGLLSASTSLGDGRARSTIVRDLLAAAEDCGLASRAALGAVACVTASFSEDEFGVATVLARCQNAFDASELYAATVSMVASAIAILAHRSGTVPATVVSWLAGDVPHESDRLAGERRGGRLLCRRQIATAAGDFTLGR